MDQSTDTKPDDQQPAAPDEQPTEKPPAKKSATRRNSRRKAAPDINEVLAAVQAALVDPDANGAEEVNEFIDTLVADRIAELPPTVKPRNIIEALVAVMSEVRAVGKEGRNEKQNYDFRGIDGTVNAIGPAMRKHGVLPVPELLSYEYGEIEVGGNRTKQAHAQVKVRYHFHYSNANGVVSTIHADVPGESMDSGDKGTAKAMSVAFRICLLQTFAIPTMQPDPDEFSYERSPGVEPLSADTLKEACKGAVKQDDLAQGFQHLREFFGPRLDTVKAPTKTGEMLDGPAYVDYAEQVAIAWRAEQAREQQDKAAHGQERATGQGDAQETRAQDDTTRAPEPAQDAQPDRAPEPAREQTPAPQRSQRKETRAEKQLRIARDELTFQADVLGVEVATYAKPACDDEDDLSTLHLAKAARFIQPQRALVIEGLREQGRATEAEAYEKIGSGFPIELGIIFEGVERADQGAPAQEPAAAK